MTHLEVTLGPLTLRNPVLTASGTFGYGLEYDDFFDVSELGGICTKGLSLEPRAGNPPERVCETPAGMLNAIGLANVGVEAFCREKLPELRRRKAGVIANIFATSVDDFVKLAERLNDEEGLDAIELNVSCPNVSCGGIEFGKDPKQCATVTAAVRKATELPLWVKMSPEAGDIVAVAKACEEAGADAISAINTIRGMSLNVAARRLRLHNRTGGLSGPALRPIALRIVWHLVDVLKIPVVAIGGIATIDDALEFLMAGARAVQVGTANFSDPRAAPKIITGLAAYCRQNSTNLSSLIGCAR